MSYIMHTNQPIEHGRVFSGELPKAPKCGFALINSLFPEKSYAYANSIYAPTMLLFDLKVDKHFEPRSACHRYNLQAMGIYAGRDYPDGFIMIRMHDTRTQIPFLIGAPMTDYESSVIEESYMTNQDCIRIIQVDVETGLFDFYAQYGVSREFSDVLYNVYSRDLRSFDRDRVMAQYKRLLSHSPQEVWNASMQWEWDDRYDKFRRIR
ncbi:hypothetical protein [Azospirillum brasilense]|uniref:hypothetical protein n=1 Tax=Azospirillum brasilense TaxID=192 RepID=UPI0011EF3A79|nr:hypothetical protein [Azospirillum brasilense]